MTREATLKIIAAILTTLLETDGGPESSLYCGLGMDMGLWTHIRTVLVGSQLVTISGHYVELTDKGRELAQKCNEALASA